MAFKVIREDEPLPPSKLVIVIYAPPGAGKTSLAFTAPNPVNFDYDKGLKRAVKRKSALQFDTWSDVIEYVDSPDFKELDPETLIQDTADNMLNDYIAHEVAKEKGNKKSSGALTQAGYGSMKVVFDSFFNRFKDKKHIIFICHEAESERDEKAVVRPKITGGAYQIVIQKADLIGYIDVTTDQSGEKVLTLDFNPSETRYAKNFAEFPPMRIPHYLDPEYDGFMERLIDKATEKMLHMSEAQKEAIEKVKELSERIGAIKTLEEATLIEAEIENMSKVYRVQLANEIDQKFIDLWKERIIGTDQLHKLLDEAAELKKLKPRFLKELVETYWATYSRHWHNTHTVKAKTPEDFNSLASEIKKITTDGIFTPDPAKNDKTLNYLIGKLANELISIAEEKNVLFNKATKLFEAGPDKTPDPKSKTKDKAKEPAKTDKKEPAKDKNIGDKSNVKNSGANKAPDTTKDPGAGKDTKGKENDEHDQEMADKAAKFIAHIRAASTLEDLELFDDLIGTLKDPYKTKVSKEYNAKLTEVTATKGKS